VRQRSSRSSGLRSDFIDRFFKRSHKPAVTDGWRSKAIFAAPKRRKPPTTGLNSERIKERCPGADQAVNQRVEAVVFYSDWAQHQIETVLIQQGADFLARSCETAFTSSRGQTFCQRRRIVLASMN
jgi:hypothetical protein